MTTLPDDHPTRVTRLLLALDGLSIGDAFGERFFGRDGFAEAAIAARQVPAPPPWRTTDDTEMAMAIAEQLHRRGAIDPDALAVAFARRYQLDPYRGYGGTAHDILQEIGAGRPWQEVAPAVFSGMGSMGNGAAMRVAPLGAYFADDLDRVVAAARASALPTHAHPDGQAGAIAVAVAAAVAWQRRDAPDGAAMLRAVLDHTPDSDTRGGIARALEFYHQGMSTRSAGRILGTGYRVISSDTVPFALLCAARHLDDFREALWTTVAGLGDRDTTCAIVGGIVAMSTGRAGLPDDWLAAREPLNFLDPPDAAR